jgi:LPS sulfotransferase NodH
VDYIEALWCLVIGRPDVTEVPQWHLDLIAERLKKYRAGDEGWKTWEEFEPELDELLK